MKSLHPPYVFCLLSLFLFLAAYSCSRKTSNQTMDNPEVILSSLTPDTLTVKLESGVGTKEFHKQPDSTVYFRFHSPARMRLHATLEPVVLGANIRFSQIFLPDGTTDGPFGETMDYPLNQEGTYLLSVHENTMAGEPWGGNAMIRISLSEQ